jgi:Uma2 family endonuclease
LGQNAVYPDLSVICNGPQAHPEDGLAATNPEVIIEILSDSTEAFDRGDKFAYYMQFTFVETHILVAQARKRIEVYERDALDGSWVLRVATEGQFAIRSLNGQFAVDDVYDGIAALQVR